MEIDINLERLMEKLLNGEIIPFLGAGVNLYARGSAEFQPYTNLPSGRELAEWLVREFKMQQQFPLAETGNKTIGEQSPLLPPLDLLDVAQYASDLWGGTDLYKRLHQVFSHDYTITPIHMLLAKVCQKASERIEKAKEADKVNGTKTADNLYYPLIVTTNYDDVLELAFKELKVPFGLAYYSTDFRKFFYRPPQEGEDFEMVVAPNEYDKASLRVCPIILKIHGTINRKNQEPEVFDKDSYLITADDYIDFPVSEATNQVLPVELARAFQLNSCLFLGYSLRDWNLRVFLSRMWKTNRQGLKHWAIVLKPTDVEEKMWVKRNVSIYEMSLEDFHARMDPFLQKIQA